MDYEVLIISRSGLDWGASRKVKISPLVGWLKELSLDDPVKYTGIR